ncbi:MAG: hypothetical protein OHM56_07345 [Spiroplasma phoeniceum]|nr:MAG: hypothetical protein OHM57_06745 [Spiroplasma phoeniceum]UZQ31453.1 MAG: hypothetical protein OHM56_07345 [Spiroplasma phoeniceum]
MFKKRLNFFSFGDLKTNFKKEIIGGYNVSFNWEYEIKNLSRLLLNI